MENEAPGLNIQEMFAFVAVDPEGNEGITGMKVGDTWMPMVGADMDRMKSLWPHAMEMQRTTGTKVKLKKFRLVSEEEMG
jgi:hypothetical protein